MLRKSCVMGMSQTAVCRNFFPLGRNSGPKMIQKVLAPNLLHGNMLRMPKLVNDKETKVRNYVPRAELKLHCSCCAFYWHHDALAVRCTDNAGHNQREEWLHPTWFKYNRNPHQYHKYIFSNIHPRTGAMLNREQTSSRNNERRGAGYSSHNLGINRQSRALARQVSGVGGFSTGFRFKFPIPT